MSRMDLASLKKYTILKSIKQKDEQKKNLIFFTPCEELQGSNIFARLAHNYNII